MDSKTAKITTVAIGPTYYVNDEGIYSRITSTNDVYRCVMTKEIFIEAYNKWIKGENND